MTCEQAGFGRLVADADGPLAALLIQNYGIAVADPVQVRGEHGRSEKLKPARLIRKDEFLNEYGSLSRQMQAQPLSLLSAGAEILAPETPIKADPAVWGLGSTLSALTVKLKAHENIRVATGDVLLL